MNLRCKPIIHIPKESDKRTLQKVYVESYENYDILWYYWIQDGPLIGIPDYEPIILVYKNKTELCCVSPRRAWEHQPDPIDKIHEPLEIVFGGLFKGTYHHPFVRHKGYDEEFEIEKNEKVQINYDHMLEECVSKEILDIARIGKGHPTRMLKPWVRVVDPVEVAEKFYKDYVIDNIYK